MYYQEETDKKERRKIIAIATAAVVIILILIVAIIVVATKKTTKTVSVTENSNTEVVIDENKDENTGEAEKTENAENKENTENKVVENKESGATTIGNLSTDTNKQSEAKASSTTTERSNNMPTTGPEEYLPIALMAGMLVAYLSSRVLAKRSA